MNKTFFLSLFVGILSSFSGLYAGNPLQQELNNGWQFRQAHVGRWLPATVPGSVHTDLMAHKLIEDPFYRNNEPTVQWIDKINWEYATTFQPTEAILSSNHQQLVFHGLDTWCDVFLNGEKIASPNNMFRTWTCDVKGILKQGDNTLLIRFYSPITKGLEEMEKYGLILPASNDYSQFGGMGDVRVSVFTRKAPYHFGWDWGPRLVPSGIWKPVVLEGWDDTKIENVFIRQPEVTKKQANLEAEINFLSDSTSTLKAEVWHKKKLIAQKEFSATASTNQISLPFVVKNPELWWSNGLGKPALSEFEIRLVRNGQTIASQTVKTGLRSLKLIRKKDDAGSTFYFELNGVPVFAKGSNMIPNDIFLPRITPQDYEKMVRDAVDANMNMIRVWGGGIYEDDHFYDLCDQYGIMVWQDFAFACAMYPGTPDFLENVRQEAVDNIIRLRNHPSLALWCGNNEIDAAWARWGWQKGYTEAEKEQIFKAYTDLFHHLLPEVITAYTDGDDYWPSSPMSDTAVNAHELLPATSGDNHYWGVWHQKHRFEEYENNIGRFISEYGFQSFPEFNTVKKYALPEDYDIESEVMAAHQRSGIGNLRIKEYMGWYYNIPEDFEQFLYLSQVLQAKAMRSAVQTHRRNMPYCMGSIMWQLNDCWPVASWSTTDYYHNWKAAQYASKEACKPIIMAPKITEQALELWVVNDLLKEIKGNYTLELFDFNGKMLNKITGKFVQNANRSNLVRTIDLNTFLAGKNKSEVVAVLRLHNNSQVWDEQTCYFTAPKDMNLPKNPGIRVETFRENGKKYLRATSNQLACDVMFYSPDAEVIFKENYIDLLPGKTYVIELETDAENYSVATRFIQ
ncbi:beta-mannosidase [Odoribacter lunatus]|uniref:beta-mannosidase n=1 Tax=Odoribacter lunatus TaxID=2941335 RepID=UPI00204202B4|nr:glycoside hydrolase family 2 protein [Odoribacter lunatus]